MNKLYVGNQEFDLSKKFTSLEFSALNPPEYIQNCYIPMSTNAEIEFECEINAPLFRQLTGVDTSPYNDMTSFGVVFKFPYQVQKRRHKKKRINKKWAKRYGYVTKFKTAVMGEAYFDPSCENEMNVYGRDLYVL